MFSLALGKGQDTVSFILIKNHNLEKTLDKKILEQSG